MADEVQKINNPNLLFATNPMIITVSDVHLGARWNVHAEFLKFLKTINMKKESGVLSNLKVFMILGDFIDVLFDSFRDLAKETLNLAVYSELNELHGRGVEILLILGNHEVPIWLSFNRHKKNFLKKFRKYNNTLSFLKEENIGQWFIMETHPDSTRTLKIYNENSDVKKNKVLRAITLPSGAGGNSHKNYLFAHGHQFTPFISIVSEIAQWNWLRRSPDFLKEFQNFLQDKTRDDPTETEIDQYLKDWENISEEDEMERINQLAAHKPDYIAYYNKTKASFDRRKKLKEPLLTDGIVDFLKSKKWPIDTIVFGHSHENFTNTSKSVNGQHLYIVNDGGWQGVGLPGYVQIELSGEIKNFLYEIKD